MASGLSHSLVQSLAAPALAVHDFVEVQADAVVVADVEAVDAAGAVVVVAEQVADLQQADHIPGMCNSTTGCIVRYNSFGFRISDIDS